MSLRERERRGRGSGPPRTHQISAPCGMTRGCTIHIIRVSTVLASGMCHCVPVREGCGWSWTAKRRGRTRLDRRKTLCQRRRPWAVAAIDERDVRRTSASGRGGTGSWMAPRPSAPHGRRHCALTPARRLFFVRPRTVLLGSHSAPTETLQTGAQPGTGPDGRSPWHGEVARCHGELKCGAERATSTVARPY